MLERGRGEGGRQKKKGKKKKDERGFSPVLSNSIPTPWWARSFLPPAVSAQERAVRLMHMERRGEKEREGGRGRER